MTHAPTTAELYAHLDALDADMAELRRPSAVGIFRQAVQPLEDEPDIARYGLALANGGDCGCDPRDIWREVHKRSE